MILADIHSHILYGVDDGAKDRADMLAILDNAYKNGVRLLCATPHYNPELFGYSRENEDAALNELCEYSREKYPDLKIHRGNEIFVYSGVPSFITESARKRSDFGDMANALVEFSSRISVSEISDTVSEISSLGLRPVIAHVERYKKITEKGIARLRLLGAVITVNAKSVVGGNGGMACRFAKKLIKHGICDAVTSDAHVAEEYDLLSAAYEFVLKKHGETVAERMFWSNANNLYKGE